MGPPAPGGHMGCRGCALAYMGQGHHPQEAHAPRDKGKRSPKGGRHLLGALGRMDSSLAAPFLGGRAKATPPSPLALYIVGGREGSNTYALAPPSPSHNTSPSSRSAWRSPVGIPLLPPPRRRAAGSPSTSPPPCWIKKEETSLLRTCVERGGAVRSALGSSVIWITTSTTPSTPFS